MDIVEQQELSVINEDQSDAGSSVQMFKEEVKDNSSEMMNYINKGLFDTESVMIKAEYMK